MLPEKLVLSKAASDVAAWLPASHSVPILLDERKPVIFDIQRAIVTRAPSNRIGAVLRRRRRLASPKSIP
jgi:hypothetical protein